MIERWRIALVKRISAFRLRWSGRRLAKSARRNDWPGQDRRGGRVATTVESIIGLGGAMPTPPRPREAEHGMAASAIEGAANQDEWGLGLFVRKEGRRVVRRSLVEKTSFPLRGPLGRYTRHIETDWVAVAATSMRTWYYSIAEQVGVKSFGL